jgi:hypothetical protein
MLRYLLALAVLLAPTTARADFVRRSAAAVARAIALGAGGAALGRDTRLRYAKALIAVARDHNFDPFTGVAIIEHESRWRSSAVSADGEDLGLAQIRARFRSGCRSDPDPVRAPSAACQRTRASLLDPVVSMRAMGSAITSWRKLCSSKSKGTGRPALLHRWLAGYGGMHRPSQGLRCGQRKVKGRWRDVPLRPGVRWIRDHRRYLLRKLRR